MPNNPTMRKAALTAIATVKGATAVHSALRTMGERPVMDNLPWDELSKVQLTLRALREKILKAEDVVADLIRTRNAQSVSGRLASERKKNKTQQQPYM